MKLLSLLVIVLTGVTSNAKYKVAVIDSGFTPKYNNVYSQSKLCKKGHYDFTTETSTLGLDDHNHGTVVTDLIAKYAETDNFCIVIYKVFNGKPKASSKTVEAFKMALKRKMNAINYSMSGREPDLHERQLLKKIVATRIAVFVAAGNDNFNLNEFCFSYPSCYKIKGIKIIGAHDAYGNRAYYSNYGSIISQYDYGDIRNGFGTSFATPRALGKYIKQLRLDK